jgi:glyoxylase-like metal-dependent hydrolase (beta-lactamase superfamily II)
MAEVKVLIEGYARESEGGFLASSSVSLIRDNDENIIVDPGINRPLLLEKMESEGLALADIDFVVLTHYHPDHALLASIFENAAILDNTTIFENDCESDHGGVVPGTAVKIISAPGHAHEHCVVLAETEKGKIVIAGDVFWWSDDEEMRPGDIDSLLNRKDPYAKDEKVLMESRRKILEIADYIVPGHGKMFEV